MGYEKQRSKVDPRFPYCQMEYYTKSLSDVVMTGLNIKVTRADGRPWVSAGSGTWFSRGYPMPRWRGVPHSLLRSLAAWYGCW